MKFAITGGSGFIGSNYILNLLKCESNLVINIDRRKSLIHDIRKITHLVDINDYQIFSKVLLDFQPDFIIHLAARTDLDGMSLEDYDSNITGVKNLMKIAQELPNLKKIIVTSSMLVCRAGYYPKDQFDYSPSTLYGQSKVETEKITWANKPNCDWAIIRPTSIWGPWFGVPYKDFFDMVIAHRYFHIGNKGCTKTYGYVENSVYQIEQILFNETLDENRKVFFIGDNPATNIEEWGNEIAAELGYKILKIPYFLIKMAALLGDFLKIAGVKFPITSFRLRNMTTNNVIDLTDTYKIAPNPPFTRVEGVKRTLNWIKHNNQ